LPGVPRELHLLSFGNTRSAGPWRHPGDWLINDKDPLPNLAQARTRRAGQLTLARTTQDMMSG
jgi:hypothetical protein